MGGVFIQSTGVALTYDLPDYLRGVRGPVEFLEGLTEVLDVQVHPVLVVYIQHSQVGVVGLETDVAGGDIHIEPVPVEGVECFCFVWGVATSTNQQQLEYCHISCT